MMLVLLIKWSVTYIMINSDYFVIFTCFNFNSLWDIHYKDVSYQLDSSCTRWNKWRPTTEDDLLRLQFVRVQSIVPVQVWLATCVYRVRTWKTGALFQVISSKVLTWHRNSSIGESFHRSSSTRSLRLRVMCIVYVNSTTYLSGHQENEF